MRISRRSLRTKLLTPVSMAVLVGGSMLVLPLRATSASAASGYSSAPTTSVGGTGTASSAPHSVPIRLPHAHGFSTVIAPGATPSTSTSSAPILHNFNGVSSVDSAKVNGFDIEPPDQGLCVGNGYVVEPVNLAITVYRANGTIVKGPQSLENFFNEPPSFIGADVNIQGDARCYFDKSTHTWFATQLFFTTALANNTSHFDVAVNSSGDPTTPWKVYRFDTTDLSTAGCPCFGDQPLFGIDQYNVYISTNEFGITSSAFNGSQIYAISKSQLIAGAAHANFVHFRNLNVGGALAASVQPAISNDANVPAEYFLSSLDPNATFDHRIGVWAMTNRQAVTSGGMPTLTNTVINSETYGYPPSAQSPVGYSQYYGQNTSGLIQTDDDRMQQVQEINGQLWSSLDTALTVPGQSTTLSGAAWFEVKPSLNGESIGTSTILNQGYVVSRGNFLLYPAVASDGNGNAAMTMTLSGPNTYPSAVYASLQSGQSSFGAIQEAAPGATADIGFTAVGGPGRWGDYSAAVLDPSGGGIWLATEYIPGSGDGIANWGTRVFEVGT